MVKSHDEIKKGLEYLSITNVAQKVEAAKKGLPYAYTEEVADDALALIQQLEAQVPRWISVEERLPKRYEHVLVATRFTDDGEPDVEIAYHAIGVWRKEEGHLYGKVTHWMPLPQPPKD